MADSKYTPALPEVYTKYLRPVLTKYHMELACAAITVLMRAGDWKSQGNYVYGQAKKVSEETQALFDADSDAAGSAPDFIIILNEDIWESLDDRTREALIDHELCHCIKKVDDNGNESWGAVGHDYEDFFSVVRHYGAWQEAAIRMYEAMTKTGQMDIDDLEGERDG